MYQDTILSFYQISVQSDFKYGRLAYFKPCSGENNESGSSAVALPTKYSLSLHAISEHVCELNW
jgi:hypothetical protein